METKLNRKIQTYTNTFKNDIKLWLENNESDAIENSKKSDFLKFVFDYQSLLLTSEDLQKRKRIKNCVPQFNRCCARRANGEQCTRRKKESCDFCGTHGKGTPHGKIQCNVADKVTLKKKEIWIQEIGGIQYYLDDEGNVYNHEDVMGGKDNPEIIAQYNFEDDIYSIPMYGISNKYTKKGGIIETPCSKV